MYETVTDNFIYVCHGLLFDRIQEKPTRALRNFVRVAYECSRILNQAGMLMTLYFIDKYMAAPRKAIIGAVEAVAVGTSITRALLVDNAESLLWYAVLCKKYLTTEQRI